jgi:hypothetical protein
MDGIVASRHTDIKRRSLAVGLPGGTTTAGGFSVEVPCAAGADPNAVS